MDKNNKRPRGDAYRSHLQSRRLDVLYINRRADGSRRAGFEATARALGVDARRIEAVTPDAAAAICDLAPDCMPAQRQLQLSVLCSHLRALREFVAGSSGEYALICEDDVDLDCCRLWDFHIDQFIDALPGHWGLVQLATIWPLVGTAGSAGLAPSRPIRHGLHRQSLRHERGSLALLYRKAYAADLFDKIAAPDREYFAIAATGLLPRADTFLFVQELAGPKWTQPVMNASLFHRRAGGEDAPLQHSGSPASQTAVLQYFARQTTRVFLHRQGSLSLQRAIGGDADAVAGETLAAFCGAWSLDAKRLGSGFHTYAVVGSGPIRGLQVERYCRLGNNLRQLAQAILFARATGLSWVDFYGGDGRGVHLAGILGAREIRLGDGLTVNIRPEPAPGQADARGAALRGCFYFRKALAPVLSEFGFAAYRAVLKNEIAGELPWLEHAEPAPAGRIHVHLRSGDVFTDPEPHKLYVQPPLSHYLGAIRRELAANPGATVVLVAEDRANPCVAALIDALEAAGARVVFREQSLRDDLRELGGAHTIVAGFGSFIPLLALTSRRLKRLVLFEHQAEALLGLDRRYQMEALWPYPDPATDRPFSLADLGECEVVIDRFGKYLRPGQWQNSAAQRQSMLAYPGIGLQPLAAAPYAEQRLPTVSLCTVTRNRRRHLHLLKQCIDRQTYPHNRIQWVILDDSDDGSEPFNSSSCHFDVVHKVSPERLVLGHKRNLSHRLCDGEIIIYMDDDDYYPPTRISHVVEQFCGSQHEVAGTSAMLIYFLADGELWLTGPYGPNHATANTLAMRRSLLQKTAYDPAASRAEEKHFLKGFKIPMIQLDPLQTIVCMAHRHNTFDKNLLRKPGPHKVMRRLDQAQARRLLEPIDTASYRRVTGLDQGHANEGRRV